MEQYNAGVYYKAHKLTYINSLDIITIPKRQRSAIWSIPIQFSLLIII